MKKLLIVIVMILFTVVLTAFSHAMSPGTSTQRNVTAFRGIESIRVVVEDLRENGKKAGVYKDDLRALVESKLIERGIPLREKKEFKIENPLLYVNINLKYVHEIVHFVYNIDLALVQGVGLLRSKNIIFAKTWSKQFLGMCTAKNAQTEIRKALEEVTLLFMNAYLDANR